MTFLLPRNSRRYKSETLEHLGLVAGVLDELGIGELVDTVAQDLEQRKVSVGQALKAMVLTGLDFANRRVSLTSRFFRNKSTERRLGEGIQAEHLNDDALGKALDKSYDYGVSALYSLIASQAAKWSCPAFVDSFGLEVQAACLRAYLLSNAKGERYSRVE